MSEQISEKPFAEKKKINIRGHQMAYMKEKEHLLFFNMETQPLHIFGVI